MPCRSVTLRWLVMYFQLCVSVCVAVCQSQPRRPGTFTAMDLYICIPCYHGYCVYGLLSLGSASYRKQSKRVKKVVLDAKIRHSPSSYQNRYPLYLLV